MALPGGSIDPITFSVLLRRFEAIALEMTLALEQSAWTSILALARDYSCAIYDARRRQIAVFDALPIHTTSLHLVLDAIADAFTGNVRNGDIFLCNHPYRGNTHVGDLVTATPVFVGGRHLFWSVTKGHQLDVGATLPTSVSSSAKSVWEEGIHIPPVKVVDRGEERSDVVDLYLSNVRYPDLQRGDLLAQLGSIRKGQERLTELVAEYGAETLLKYVDEIISYADRRMAAAIRDIPDGEYSAQMWVDSDGVSETDIPIRVKIVVSDDVVDIDYEGSGAQSPGGANCSYAASQAAPAVPFLYYIDPDIPHNHGCLAHIRVRAPEGSICNARFPASTSCATILPADAMHDVVNRAMAGPIPELVVAGSARAANTPSMSGRDTRNGKAWGAMLFNLRGGGGAAKDTDGWPLIGSLAAMGGVKALAIEQLELLYPVLIGQMEVESDSMGCGEWLGGPGIRFVLEPLHGTIECTTHGDGFRNPPHGVLGGRPGIGGGQYVEDLSTHRRVFVSATGYIRIREGQRFVSVSTGGGGYGDPLKRPAEKVRSDVMAGFVSRRTAIEVFGVVLSDAADHAVDEMGTHDRRLLLRSNGLEAIVDPGRPNTGDWARSNTRQDDEFLLNPTPESWCP
jgi:N-methylhydantoinase B